MELFLDYGTFGLINFQNDRNLSKLIKYSILVLGMASIFYLDFVRDYIFKNIGFQIYYLEHLNNDGISTINNYTDSFFESFIKDYSIPQLNNLKWIFTTVFISIFGALGAIVNTVFYSSKKVALYFIYLYGGLVLCSFLIYLTMNLSNSYNFQMKAYLISMEIAHLLQSSLPTLFFLVSFKLYKQHKT